MAITFGRNAEAFVRVLNSTIADYSDEKWDNLLRERYVWSKMKENGCFAKQSGGDQYVWSVKHHREPLKTLQDMGTITFSRINRHVQAALPPRGYHVEDQVTLIEKWMNSSDKAIIKIVNDAMSSLIDDMTDQLPDSFWVDGNAGSQQTPHGIESLLSYSSTISGNDRVGNCNDDYAQLSTAFGQKGLWGSTAFPNGSGSPGYHYFSPFILKTDVDYGASSNTWADSCLRIMRYAVISQMLRKCKVDCFVLTPTAYQDVANKLEEREQIRTVRGESIKQLETGIGPAIKFESVEVATEYGIPVTDAAGETVSGYGLNFKGIKCRHWSPKMIFPLPVDMAIETLSDRMLVLSFFNFFFDPQKVVKLTT